MPLISIFKTGKERFWSRRHTLRRIEKRWEGRGPFRWHPRALVRIAGDFQSSKYTSMPFSSAVVSPFETSILRSLRGPIPVAAAAALATLLQPLVLSFRPLCVCVPAGPARFRRWPEIRACHATAVSAFTRVCFVHFVCSVVRQGPTDSKVDYAKDRQERNHSRNNP